MDLYASRMRAQAGSSTLDRPRYCPQVCALFLPRAVGPPPNRRLVVMRACNSSAHNAHTTPILFLSPKGRGQDINDLVPPSPSSSRAHLLAVPGIILKISCKEQDTSCPASHRNGTPLDLSHHRQGKQPASSGSAPG